MKSPVTIPPVSDSNAWNIRFNTIRRSSSMKLNGINIEMNVMTPNRGINVSVAFAKSF